MRFRAWGFGVGKCSLGDKVDRAGVDRRATDMREGHEVHEGTAIPLFPEKY